MSEPVVIVRILSAPPEEVFSYVESGKANPHWTS
jgi:hypothetical protein